MGPSGALRAALWALLLPLISAQEGILHAFSNDNPLLKKDYCITYNPSWTSLPSSLSSAIPTKLTILTPKLLCNSSDVPHDIMRDKAAVVMRGNCSFLEKAWIAQGLGAKILLIASQTGLDTPSGDRTMYKNLSIPIALISNVDVLDINKSLGNNVSVTLYSPPLPEFDFSMVVIFLIAVLTVALGGFWSGMEELEELKAAASSDNTPVSRKTSESIILNPVKVVVFVVLSCVMLVLLYYFYQWLVYIIIAIFCLASSISLYNCLQVLIRKIPFGQCRISCFNTAFEVRLFLLAGLCIAAAVVWGVFRNEDSWAWILQDILGISFCLNFIRTLRMPNFKSCVILLGLLLLYDVFFVFITPFLTKNGESIMVEVATGPFKNSEKNYGNMLEASVQQSAPHEKLPVVMRVPRLQFCTPMVCGLPFSLLGFGDIILPGLLVAYCHRFDVQTSSSSVYYISCSLAYAVGMVLTFVVLSLMKMAQPALLYLVPCILATSAIVAWSRKEMKKFWEGNNYQVMDPMDCAAAEENSTLSSEQCGGQ
ncbi:signal peptide peptidase-like 2A isoform X1 [Sphaerodactylus townsendi]|uniref:signal peptide peptidase-like 2A isoform X1 n=1 Tax=Sphaerodactylus townsendi TaxID=933632 RepID=UPI002025CA7A|nr:signal peptide peptidase-like 2A isoform X1 [Sphaerodactylus townsendi]